MVADQLRPKFQKLSELMDGAEADVLPYMCFPKAHRMQIHTTNPLKRLNAYIKCRTDVVGIFPNPAAVTQLCPAGESCRLRNSVMRASNISPRRANLNQVTWEYDIA